MKYLINIVIIKIDKFYYLLDHLLVEDIIPNYKHFFLIFRQSTGILNHLI